MFFVMLNHPSDSIPAVPLIDPDSDNIGFYETEGEAGCAAESSHLGEEWGYEIFELGCGIG